MIDFKTFLWMQLKYAIKLHIRYQALFNKGFFLCVCVCSSHFEQTKSDEKLLKNATSCEFSIY